MAITKVKQVSNMGKKGKRLREFEKNNRVINLPEAQKKREARRKNLGTKKPLDIEEDQTTAGSPEKRKKKRNKIVNIKRFVGCVIAVIFIASISMSAIKIFKLKSEEDLLLAKKAELIKLKEGLTAEMEHINSTEYIERYARKELKMIKSGEILYLTSDDEKDENEEKEAE